MKASEYKKRTTKQVVCPSGLTVNIRKILSVDYLMMGILPDTLTTYRTKVMSDQPIENPQLAVDLQVMFLTRAVIPTQDLKIVDKPIEECTENELSVYQLEEEDSLCLIQEITEFSFGDAPKEDQFQEVPKQSVAETPG